jgi:hypothetical protein
MDLYLLDPLGLAAPDPRLVDAGWARAIREGPMTVDQVLARGLAAMLDEDRAEEMARDPILYARAHRPRRLVDALLTKSATPLAISRRGRNRPDAGRIHHALWRILGRR